jgi:formylglycine-generating enzyme required for sulfatase activity/GH25 family lysozyme M1 (1,4-beta-N-acetylmuramidase)
MQKIMNMKRTAHSYLIAATSLILLAICTPAAAQTELIQNGGFESGSTGWSLSGPSIWSSFGFAHSGSYYLWLGDDNGTDTAYQTVTIPSGATAATLSFYYNINSSEPAGAVYDTFTATIRDTSGNILATVGSWSNLNGTSPGNPYYHQQTFSALPYAGRTILVYFASSCRLVSSQTTNFRVDDVSLQVTAGQPVLSVTPASPATQPATAGSLSLSVNNAGSGTMSYSASVTGGSSWLTITSGGSGGNSGTIVLSYGANNTGSQRSGTVTVTASGASGSPVNVTITQAATQPILSVTPANPPTQPAAAGSLSLSVNNTGSGTMSYSAAVTSGSSWLSVTSGGSGGNSGTIVLSYSANQSAQRSGTVQVTAAGASGSPVTVTITQTGISQPLGVDVSSWNGSVNWGQVRSTGSKAFAFIRATAGKNTTDSEFALNAANAQSAGVVIGTYHFAYPEYFTAHEEAQKFLSVARTYVGAGHLPPALDIEDSPSENSYPYGLGAAVLSQWARDWCSEVKQSTGVTPMIYTTRWYARNYFQSDLSQYLLWVPTYPTFPDADPGSLGPWSTWTFQQYRTDPTTQGTDPGSTTEPYTPGTCPGVSGYADLDSFNGDLDALNALANRTPAPVLAVSPSDGLTASGNQGGPFTPPSKSYTVSNGGGGTLNWTVGADQNWVTVSPASGQNSATVTVSLNANANLLSGSSVGTVYTATVAFGGNGGNTARQVQLTVYTPPPPPARLGGPSVSNCVFSFILNGPVGSNFVVEASTDLAHWTPVSTNTIPAGGSVTITDPGACNHPHRFYRAVWVAQANPDPDNLVWISPGTFTMGSPATEQDRRDNEGPQTQVTMSKGFWMSKYEVTQGNYQAVTGANPSHFTGDSRRPVDSETWYDATNYCGALTARERAAGRLPAGYAYRLPTEAEWEYACRAGTTTRFYYGDDTNYTDLGQYAWYEVNTGRQTTYPVGLKLPNKWGLYDMMGNLWEWCSDWYGSSYPGGNVDDPTGPPSGSSRVIRGGSWWDGTGCRSAYRSAATPDYRNYDMGFRPVLALGQ